MAGEEDKRKKRCCWILIVINILILIVLVVAFIYVIFIKIEVNKIEKKLDDMKPKVTTIETTVDSIQSALTGHDFSPVVGE